MGLVFYQSSKIQKQQLENLYTSCIKIFKEELELKIGNLLNTLDILSDGQVVYASQTITGCESESRLQITVQVQTISPPTTIDITQCDTGQTITATATTADPAQTITWYDAATGGSIVSDPSLTYFESV